MERTNPVTGLREKDSWETGVQTWTPVTSLRSASEIDYKEVDKEKEMPTKKSKNALKFGASYKPVPPKRVAKQISEAEIDELEDTNQLNDLPMNLDPGFTPVLYPVIKDCGPMAALVFGRVWRYTQGDYRFCTASLPTIAENLGIKDVKTVRTHLDCLCKKGYLEKIKRAGRSDKFRDTGKINVKLAMRVGNAKEE